MLDNLLKEIHSKYELDKEDWLKLSNALNTLKNDEAILLCKAVSTHTGIALTSINSVLPSLTRSADPVEQQQIIIQLHNDQLSATQKISAFQEHRYIKDTDTAPLEISRANWLALIHKFEQQKRKHVTAQFFISNVSTIKKMSEDKINALLRKTQPQRQVKATPDLDEKLPLRKRRHHSFLDDNKENCFILQSNGKNPDLEERIKSVGARVTPLCPSTPVKGYSDIMSTPGGSKVRAVYKGGSYALFKPLTPYGKKPQEGKVKIEEHSPKDISQALPKLHYQTAEPIEFIATLAGIHERSGKKRKPTLATMGESAANVFKAYGVELQSPAESRAIHWSHLIAHFFSDEQDLITADSEQEIVNLVPATAAANYNILEAIELFIKDKLVDELTDKIRIHVAPIYSGESLIPDELIYTLTWSEINTKGVAHPYKEIFNIHPQSYYRFTKNNHKCIELLRKTIDKQCSSTDDHEEDNNDKRCQI